MRFSRGRSKAGKGPSGSEIAVGIRQPDLTPELSRKLLYPIVDAIAEAARTDTSDLAAKLLLEEERERFTN